MSIEILDPEMEKPFGFTPNSWPQQQVLVSEAPEVLYSGRYGSSKTRTIAEKLDYRCRKHGNSRCVLARKRRTDLGATTLPVLLEQTVTPSHVAWGYRASADGGSTLYYPNGSSILCVGLDDPGKLRSGQYDMAAVDQCEQLELEEWQAINGRLRWIPQPYENENGFHEDAFQQLIGACNPDSPGHFLYTRFDPTYSHRLWTTEDLKLPNGATLKAGHLWGECILAGGLDNMENLPASYLARLAMFKGRYYDRYVLGKWVAFEGVVYDMYDRGLHVCRRPLEWLTKWGGYPPPSWPIFRAIDFGFVNPFVCQWWTKSPDGTWYMFREIYMTRRTIVAHAELIKKLERKHYDIVRQKEHENARLENRREIDFKYLNLYHSFSDHDAGDRALLDEHDIITDAANKDVSAGIQTCYHLLAPQQGPDGTFSRIRFIEDALVEKDENLVHEERPVRTVEEFLGYKYTARRDSDTSKEMREEPMKENDHGLDAMRMLLHSEATIGELTVSRV